MVSNKTELSKRLNFALRDLYEIEFLLRDGKGVEAFLKSVSVREDLVKLRDETDAGTIK
jgi:hypothetical protein